MNNTFFNKDIFPDNSYKEHSIKMPSINYTLPTDESYMYNLIRNNVGKQICIYLTFPMSNDFKDFKFNGILENSGKDYVILSEPSSGKWHLFPTIYIDFITFDENINFMSNN